jgi:uncharacterized repeat protein (TIGR03803 family)
MPRERWCRGPDGTLYGVTTDGGAGAAGLVFRIQTNGTGLTVLKNFPLADVITGTNSDGANPQAGLVLSGSMLFGTTMNGGSGGKGTVFSLNTNGTSFAVLKNFTALDKNTGTNSDGANPVAALVVSNGVLYGTAQNGGATGFGTIFRVNTNGNGFTNLYSFSNGSDGADPAAGLVLSGNTLYGTAQYGGDNGDGTVFSISTNGTSFNLLHRFSGSGTDGANPVAGLVLSGGLLYGTTPYGDSDGISDDGTVFRVSVTGGSSFTNLYSFIDGEGFMPMAELLLLGNTLYGTTGNGGVGGGYFGTLFKISTNGTNFTTICSLTGNEGWGPQCGLLLSGGKFYGTTVSGGILPEVFAFAYGTVFSVSTNGTGLTDLCIFTEASGAADPWTALALSGNTLYGTTLYGGTNNNGTLFEINTNGSSYAEIKDFSIEGSGGDNPDGADPRAALVLSGGTFYGTTRYGGTGGYGTIFKLNSDGTGFTNIYSFPSTNPATPIAALVVSGSTLYGTTPQGGAGFGSVFRINTNGTGYTNIYSFNGTDGNLPIAGLVLSGSILYGTTTGGGSAGQGNLFQVNTDGTHYTNIYSFSPTVFSGAINAFTNSDGTSPGTVLVLSNNVLYGTAYHGGTNGQGTMFKINTDRSGFTVLHYFAGTNSSGAGPDDLLLSGGTLYGATQYGGSSDKGTVFKITTAGSGFTVLKNFTGGSDGANPMAGLVLSSNMLYGTTRAGGLSGHGTVFSLGLSSTLAPIPLNITNINRVVVLNWSDSAFLLQASTLVTGVYTNVPGATSPYTNTFKETTKFFRLQAN